MHVRQAHVRIDKSNSSPTVLQPGLHLAGAFSLPHCNTLSCFSHETTWSMLPHQLLRKSWHQREQRTTRRVVASAAASPEIPLFSHPEVKPDLTLEAASLSKKVHVFGIEHTSPQPSIAEFILRTRPRAVIVETAVTPEHGARPGNTITCKDRMIESSAAFYMRMFCQVAAALQEEAKQCDDDITKTMTWQQVSCGPYRGEQLVYIAALAHGIPVVFGDRPKDITYRRLYTVATTAQLDEGFAQQCSVNYMNMLGITPPTPTLESASMVQRITMQEREAVMCGVASDVASGMLPVATPAAATEDASDESSSTSCVNNPDNDGDIVMVVGSAHISGIEMLWHDGGWKELLQSTHTLGSPLLSSPPLDVVPEKEVGLKRGLLAAVMGMTATQEVIVDMEQTLGPVPQFQEPAYEAVTEVYSTCRLMLSCLDRELLNKVCQGIKQGDGSQVDMYQALQDVRSIRPSYGGPAYSDEIITFLRSLNFELD